MKPFKGWFVVVLRKWMREVWDRVESSGACAHYFGMLLIGPRLVSQPANSSLELFRGFFSGAVFPFSLFFFFIKIVPGHICIVGRLG